MFKEINKNSNRRCESDRDGYNEIQIVVKEEIPTRENFFGCS